WWNSFRRTLRIVFSFLLWCVIVLTFSKGVLVAVAAVALITTRRKQAFGLIGIGAAAYAVLLPLQPYLWERVYGPTVRNPIAAQYATPWNEFQQQPSTSERIPLHVVNSGV